MRSDERDFCKSFFKVVHALNFCQARCHPRDSKDYEKREKTTQDNSLFGVLYSPMYSTLPKQSKAFLLYHCH